MISAFSLNLPKRYQKVLVYLSTMAFVVYFLLVVLDLDSGSSSKIPLFRPMPDCSSFIRDQLTPKGESELGQSDFQMISNETDYKMHMYSAYFDTSLNMIKIIGGVKIPSFWNFWFIFNSKTVYCHYYDVRKRLISITTGQIIPVERLTDPPYGGAFIVCQIEDGITQDCSSYPSYVSISLDKPDLNPTGLPSNMFYIRYPPSPNASPLPIEFSLCVQPTFDYDNPQRFVEWIEYYLLMGVGSFTFYNVSIGPTTSCLMRLYQKRWTQLEVLPWTLGFVPFVEFAQYGQLIQINDCMYRARGHSKYVVNVDLDEFIVPNYNSGSNFNELIQKITVSVPSAMVKGPSAFVFQNGYFFINEALEEYSTKNESNLIIESKILRAKHLHLPFRRTKYIANPKLVDQAEVHYVKQSVGLSEMIVVPPDTAYLHHYRAMKGTKDDGAHVIEKSATRFGPALRHHIEGKMKTFKEECGFTFHL